MSYSYPRATQGALIGNFGSSLTTCILSTDIVLDNFPDGNIDATSYQWTIISKPNGSAATLVNAQTAIATLTPIDMAGTYLIELNVDGNVKPILLGVPLLEIQDGLGKWRIPGYKETAEDNQVQTGWSAALQTIISDTHTLLEFNQNLFNGTYNYFYDDFLGIGIMPQWNLVNAALLVNEINGIMQLSTIGLATLELDTNFDNALVCTAQSRARFDAGNLGTLATHYFGFDDLGGNYAYFKIELNDGGGTLNKIYAEGDGGAGGPYSEVLTSDIDANWHIYKIECFANGAINFYIDNMLTAVKIAPITTLPATAIMNLGWYINSTGPAQLLDIDYVKVWQNRT